MEIDEYKRDLHTKQEEFDDKESKVAKEKKVIGTFMWNLLFPSSQRIISYRMGLSSINLAKAAVEFETLSQHILEVHHPDYQGFIDCRSSGVKYCFTTLHCVATVN